MLTFGPADAGVRVPQVQQPILPPPAQQVSAAYSAITKNLGNKPVNARNLQAAATAAAAYTTLSQQAIAQAAMLVQAQYDAQVRAASQAAPKDAIAQAAAEIANDKLFTPATVANALNAMQGGHVESDPGRNFADYGGPFPCTVDQPDPPPALMPVQSAPTVSEATVQMQSYLNDGMSVPEAIAAVRIQYGGAWTNEPTLAEAVLANQAPAQMPEYVQHPDGPDPVGLASAQLAALQVFDPSVLEQATHAMTAPAPGKVPDDGAAQAATQLLNDTPGKPQTGAGSENAAQYSTDMTAYRASLIQELNAAAGRSGTAWFNDPTQIDAWLLARQQVIDRQLGPLAVAAQGTPDDSPANQTLKTAQQNLSCALGEIQTLADVDNVTVPNEATLSPAARQQSLDLAQTRRLTVDLQAMGLLALNGGTPAQIDPDNPQYNDILNDPAIQALRTRVQRSVTAAAGPSGAEAQPKAEQDLRAASIALGEYRGTVFYPGMLPAVEASAPVQQRFNDLAGSVNADNAPDVVHAETQILQAVSSPTDPDLARALYDQTFQNRNQLLYSVDHDQWSTYGLDIWDRDKTAQYYEDVSNIYASLGGDGTAEGRALMNAVRQRMDSDNFVGHTGQDNSGANIKLYTLGLHDTDGNTHWGGNPQLFVDIADSEPGSGTARFIDTELNLPHVQAGDTGAPGYVTPGSNPLAGMPVTVTSRADLVNLLGQSYHQPQLAQPQTDGTQYDTGAVVYGTTTLNDLVNAMLAAQHLSNVSAGTPMVVTMLPVQYWSPDQDPRKDAPQTLSLAQVDGDAGTRYVGPAGARIYDNYGGFLKDSGLPVGGLMISQQQSVHNAAGQAIDVWDQTAVVAPPTEASRQAELQEIGEVALTVAATAVLTFVSAGADGLILPVLYDAAQGYFAFTSAQQIAGSINDIASNPASWQNWVSGTWGIAADAFMGASFLGHIGLTRLPAMLARGFEAGHAMELGEATSLGGRLLAGITDNYAGAQVYRGLAGAPDWVVTASQWVAHGTALTNGVLMLAQGAQIGNAIVRGQPVSGATVIQFLSAAGMGQFAKAFGLRGITRLSDLWEGKDSSANAYPPSIITLSANEDGTFSNDSENRGALTRIADWMRPRNVKATDDVTPRTTAQWQPRDAATSGVPGDGIFVPRAAQASPAESDPFRAGPYEVTQAGILIPSGTAPFRYSDSRYGPAETASDESFGPGSSVTNPQQIGNAAASMNFSEAHSPALANEVVTVTSKTSETWGSESNIPRATLENRSGWAANAAQNLNPAPAQNSRLDIANAPAPFVMARQESAQSKRYTSTDPARFIDDWRSGALAGHAVFVLDAAQSAAANLQASGLGWITRQNELTWLQMPAVLPAHAVLIAVAHPAYINALTSEHLSNGLPILFGDLHDFDAGAVPDHLIAQFRNALMDAAAKPQPMLRASDLATSAPRSGSMQSLLEMLIGVNSAATRRTARSGDGSSSWTGQTVQERIQPVASDQEGGHSNHRDTGDRQPGDNREEDDPHAYANAIDDADSKDGIETDVDISERIADATNSMSTLQDLFAEAAAASGVSELSSIVDEVRLIDGRSTFYIAHDGRRVIALSADVRSQDSEEAQLTEAIHEIVHAQLHDRYLRLHGEDYADNYSVNERTTIRVARIRSKVYLALKRGANEDEILQSLGHDDEHEKRLVRAGDLPAMMSISAPDISRQWFSDPVEPSENDAFVDRDDGETLRNNKNVSRELGAVFTRLVVSFTEKFEAIRSNRKDDDNPYAPFDLQRAVKLSYSDEVFDENRPLLDVLPENLTGDGLMHALEYIRDLRVQFISREPEGPATMLPAEALGTAYLPVPDKFFLRNVNNVQAIPIGEYGDEFTLDVMRTATILKNAARTFIKDETRQVDSQSRANISKTDLESSLPVFLDGIDSVADALVHVLSSRNGGPDSSEQALRLVIEHRIPEELSLRLGFGLIAPMRRRNQVLDNLIVWTNGEPRVNPDLTRLIRRQNQALTAMQVNSLPITGQGCPVAYVDRRGQTGDAPQELSGVQMLSEIFLHVMEDIAQQRASGTLVPIKDVGLETQLTVSRYSLISSEVTLDRLVRDSSSFEYANGLLVQRAEENIHTRYQAVLAQPDYPTNELRVQLARAMQEADLAKMEQQVIAFARELESQLKPGVAGSVGEAIDAEGVDALLQSAPSEEETRLLNRIRVQMEHLEQKRASIDPQPDERARETSVIVAVEPERTAYSETASSAAKTHRPLSETEAHDWFERFAESDAIVWTQDGCEARLQLMARMMSDAGITPKQTWLLPPPGTDAMMLVPEQSAGWSWHVMLSADVRLSDGTVQTWVFDPLLSDAPCPVSQLEALALRTLVVAETPMGQSPLVGDSGDGFKPYRRVVGTTPYEFAQRWMDATRDYHAGGDEETYSRTVRELKQNYLESADERPGAPSDTAMGRLFPSYELDPAYVRAEVSSVPPAAVSQAQETPERSSGINETSPSGQAIRAGQVSSESATSPEHEPEPRPLKWTPPQSPGTSFMSEHAGDMLVVGPEGYQTVIGDVSDDGMILTVTGDEISLHEAIAESLAMGETDKPFYLAMDGAAEGGDRSVGQRWANITRQETLVHEPAVSRNSKGQVVLTGRGTVHRFVPAALQSPDAALDMIDGELVRRDAQGNIEAVSPEPYLGELLGAGGEGAVFRLGSRWVAKIMFSDVDGRGILARGEQVLDRRAAEGFPVFRPHGTPRQLPGGAIVQYYGLMEGSNVDVLKPAVREGTSEEGSLPLGLNQQTIEDLDTIRDLILQHRPFHNDPEFNDPEIIFDADGRAYLCDPVQDYGDDYEPPGPDQVEQDMLRIIAEVRAIAQAHGNHDGAPAGNVSASQGADPAGTVSTASPDVPVEEDSFSSPDMPDETDRAEQVTHALTTLPDEWHPVLRDIASDTMAITRLVPRIFPDEDGTTDYTLLRDADTLRHTALTARRLAASLEPAGTYGSRLIAADNPVDPRFQHAYDWMATQIADAATLIERHAEAAEIAEQRKPGARLLERLTSAAGAKAAASRDEEAAALHLSLSQLRTGIVSVLDYLEDSGTESANQHALDLLSADTGAHAVMLHDVGTAWSTLDGTLHRYPDSFAAMVEQSKAINATCNIVRADRGEARPEDEEQSALARFIDDLQDAQSLAEPSMSASRAERLAQYQQQWMNWREQVTEQSADVQTKLDLTMRLHSEYERQRHGALPQPVAPLQTFSPTAILDALNQPVNDALNHAQVLGEIERARLDLGLWLTADTRDDPQAFAQLVRAIAVGAALPESVTHGVGEQHLTQMWQTLYGGKKLRGLDSVEDHALWGWKDWDRQLTFDERQNVLALAEQWDGFLNNAFVELSAQEVVPPRLAMTASDAALTPSVRNAKLQAAQVCEWLDDASTGLTALVDGTAHDPASIAAVERLATNLSEAHALLSAIRATGTDDPCVAAASDAVQLAIEAVSGDRDTVVHARTQLESARGALAAFAIEAGDAATADPVQAAGNAPVAEQTAVPAASTGPAGPPPIDVPPRIGPTSPDPDEERGGAHGDAIPVHYFAPVSLTEPPLLPTTGMPPVPVPTWQAWHAPLPRGIPDAASGGIAYHGPEHSAGVARGFARNAMRIGRYADGLPGRLADLDEDFFFRVGLAHDAHPGRTHGTPPRVHDTLDEHFDGIRAELGFDDFQTLVARIVIAGTAHSPAEKAGAQWDRGIADAHATGQIDAAEAAGLCVLVESIAMVDQTDAPASSASYAELYRRYEGLVAEWGERDGTPREAIAPAEVSAMLESGFIEQVGSPAWRDEFAQKRQRLIDDGHVDPAVLNPLLGSLPGRQTSMDRTPVAGPGWRATLAANHTVHRAIENGLVQDADAAVRLGDALAQADALLDRTLESDPDRGLLEVYTQYLGHFAAGRVPDAFQQMMTFDESVDNLGKLVSEWDDVRAAQTQYATLADSERVGRNSPREANWQRLIDRSSVASVVNEMVDDAEAASAAVEVETEVETEVELDVSTRSTDDPDNPDDPDDAGGTGSVSPDSTGPLDTTGPDSGAAAAVPERDANDVAASVDRQDAVQPYDPAQATRTGRTRDDGRGDWQLGGLAVRGTETQVEMLAETLNHLAQDPASRDEIAWLDAHGKTRIVLNDVLKARYKPVLMDPTTDGTIWWDPCAANLIGDEIQSAATILRHEIDHACRHQRSPDEYSQLRRSDAPGFPNQLEQSAVEAESVVARRSGEPVRTHYGDKLLIRVSGPLDRTVPPGARDGVDPLDELDRVMEGLRLAQAQAEDAVAQRDNDEAVLLGEQIAHLFARLAKIGEGGRFERVDVDADTRAKLENLCRQAGSWSQDMRAARGGYGGYVPGDTVWSGSRIGLLQSSRDNATSGLPASDSGEASPDVPVRSTNRLADRLSRAGSGETPSAPTAVDVAQTGRADEPTPHAVTRTSDVNANADADADAIADTRYGAALTVDAMQELHERIIRLPQPPAIPFIVDKRRARESDVPEAVRRRAAPREIEPIAGRGPDVTSGMARARRLQSEEAAVARELLGVLHRTAWSLGASAEQFSSGSSIGSPAIDPATVEVRGLIDHHRRSLGDMIRRMQPDTDSERSAAGARRAAWSDAQPPTNEDVIAAITQGSPSFIDTLDGGLRSIGQSSAALADALRESGDVAGDPLGVRPTRWPEGDAALPYDVVIGALDSLGSLSLTTLDRLRGGPYRRAERMTTAEGVLRNLDAMLAQAEQYLSLREARGERPPEGGLFAINLADERRRLAAMRDTLVGIAAGGRPSDSLRAMQIQEELRRYAFEVRETLIGPIRAHVDRNAFGEWNPDGLRAIGGRLARKLLPDVLTKPLNPPEQGTGTAGAGEIATGQPRAHGQATEGEGGGVAELNYRIRGLILVIGDSSPREHSVISLLTKAQDWSNQLRVGHMGSDDRDAMIAKMQSALEEAVVWVDELRASVILVAGARQAHLVEVGHPRDHLEQMNKLIRAALLAIERARSLVNEQAGRTKGLNLIQPMRLLRGATDNLKQYCADPLGFGEPTTDEEVQIVEGFADEVYEGISTRSAESETR